ncbi:MAG TPA: hypothetical protein VFN08_04480, partial [Gemmatimonadales bacterium]|nr:hypothetical protein [Gemmatimonadales bacterium]
MPASSSADESRAGAIAATPAPAPPYRRAPRAPILPASQTILLGAHTGPGRLRPKEGVMTRQYEVVYIFDSALEEAAINER